jgi:hypothetical protein
MDHVKTQFPCGRHFGYVAVAFLLSSILSPVVRAADIPARTVSLAWNANPEDNVAGYKVRFGTASGLYPQVIDVTSQASVILPQMFLGNTYYMTVSAYNTAGQEGPASAEFTVTPVLPQPAESTSFAIGGPGQGELQWKYPQSSAAPAESFAIYASEDLATWSVAGNIPVSGATRTDDQWRYFSFPMVANKPRMFFRVGAVNPFGESQ